MEEEHNIVLSTEVERAPDVIRKAKYEVGRTDILVCGNCHNTFYHVEEFQQHRSDDKCIQDSILRENEKVEPKEQVWAFTLWKNATLSSGKRTEPLTTWSLFKQWCNLNELEKEGWIIAGQNLQTFTKLSLSRMHEIRGKTQSILKSEKANITQGPTQNSELEEGEVRLSQLTEAQKAAIKAQIAANKESTPSDLKKVPLKLAQLYVELLKKPLDQRKALRTGKNSTIEEMSFEKILSRRFNHKNRCLEYYVKWDNMKESDNTWEPKGHFERCKHILDDFDKVFNSSKNIPSISDSQLLSEGEQQTPSRPPRSSKQKAKDQVKSWCDSMSDDEEEVSKKRLFDEDSDSSDSFEKKMKFEEESDSSEEEKPSKKLKAGASVNGIANKKSVDSMPQRIVRVSQKHLPNLSTGVYIMSKTEGIIKLNSDTSLPSSSSLLKVGQRIGQTHIKVVKKDSKGATKAGKSPSVGLPPVKVLASTATNANAPEGTAEEDESDGIPELEFPTDLPLPEPESPPGDFVLDPLTGKIAGQEYEEQKNNTEVIAESEPEQEPTSLDTLVKMAVSDLPDVEDIPNDDKISAEAKDASEPSETPAAKPDTAATLILDSPSPPVKSDTKIASNKEASNTSKNVVTTEIDLESAITLTAIEKVVPAPKPKLKPRPSTATAASILNAALTSSRMPPKKLLSATPSTIRQKVMPHSQMRMPSPTTTIIHKVQSRPKTFPQRMHQHHQLIEPIVRRSPTVNTYRPAASNVSRRIGNTTIYKTNTKQQFAQPPIKPQPLYKRTFVSRVTSVSTPPAPTPISMPLIGIEDESEAIQSTSAAISDTTDSDLLQHLSNDLPTINLADTETPLFITGEDGTIYQVAGQNEEGQTILISEGPDGQQQCVIVTTETAEEESSQALVLSAAVESNEQQLQVTSKMDVDETEVDDLGDDSQVVAQIVKADPPSPGGTRKVVLMLPDGNLMMTDVTAEQYAALELDK